MAAADFSAIPAEPQQTFVRRAFGSPVVPVIVGGIVVIMVGAWFAPNAWRQPVLVALSGLAIAAAIFTMRRNSKAQLRTMAEFAAINGWQYEGPAKTQFADIPPDPNYGTHPPTRSYRITGSNGSHEFELYQVTGLTNVSGRTSQYWKTVLNAHGTRPENVGLDYVKATQQADGVQVIMAANAVTREDVAAMFRAAGLVSGGGQRKV